MDSHTDFVKATRAGKARVGFYIHLAAYLAVNALLVYINLAASPGRLWFQWPLIGWGVGLAAHALAVFVLPRVLRSGGGRS
jgi:2TM domain